MAPVSRRPTRPVQKRCVLREREIRALELAAQGLNQQQIAAELGLTRSGISKMLIRTERKLATLLKDRGEEIKASQTSKLQHIYRESMQAWERSKGDTASVKTITGGRDGERTETTVRGECGDPRFLDEARGALADVRKIWGLEEASRRSDGESPVQIQVNFSEDFFGRRMTVDESNAIDVVPGGDANARVSEELEGPK